MAAGTPGIIKKYVSNEGLDYFYSKLKQMIKTTTKNITLSAAGWNSGTYTITDSLITATSNQEIIPGLDITADQYKALQKAMIIDGGQTDGSLTLKALGTVPTIDIPIRIIYRGVK